MTCYCPQCGAAQDAADMHVGDPVTCSHCNATFVVPEPAPTTAQPQPVPTEDDIAPNVVVWLRSKEKGEVEPVCVADVMLGPGYLGIVRRGTVPTVTSRIDPEAHRHEGLRFVLALGGMYLIDGTKPTPGSSKHTDESRLEGLFRRAAKQRAAERAMPLAERLRRNEGSFTIDHREIAAVEKQEAGTVRLRLFDGAYYLTVYQQLNRFRRWVRRLSSVSGVAVSDPRPARPSDGRIRVDCPTCGRIVAAPQAKAGAAVRCMYCGESVTLPDVAGVEPPARTGAASMSASPRDNILEYVRFQAEGRLKDGARFLAALTTRQKAEAAAGLLQMHPDELAHPDLADVPPPVVRRFMNQMRDELQHRGSA